MLTFLLKILEIGIKICRHRKMSNYLVAIFELSYLQIYQVRRLVTSRTNLLIVPTTLNGMKLSLLGKV